MADSNKCKRKKRMQEQLLLLSPFINENKYIIKGTFGVGVTSKTEGDTGL